MLEERIGGAFSLLMQVRMLIAAITLGLVPSSSLELKLVVLVAIVLLVSWQAARRRRTIVPWLLRSPGWLIIDVGLSFVVLAIGGSSGPFLLATVVTAAIAGLLYGWRGMMISAVQVAGYYTAFLLTVDRVGTDLATFQTVLGQPVYYPLVGYAGVALRRLFEQQVAEARARTRAEAMAAAAEERGRLAREMHDSLAKTLSGIAMAATALPLWVTKDTDRAAREAAELAAATAIASREARSLLNEMRSDNLTRPLPEALREVVDRWAESSGLRVECELRQDVDMSLRARYEVLSILSEVLSNVERHAEASAVEVRLDRQDDTDGGMAVLTIRDDGRGFRVESLEHLVRAGHYGLVGLHERAERVGGTVEVGSVPGAGTTVRVRLPVRELDSTSGSTLAEVG
ncbi:hypothetical protein Acsp03_64030 [Actinomadura sp. NBRC 104412]|uniref:sensor histidine kinase n=1 Tax=Actinomadura sp. NBRC 104412 TaxID=3032203 RepID=UPI0024A36E51|nr:ATP-binding protein [Actinomadura sp. NBRC 104412]GLZ08937.1 hypothetical protein Acsp03_64030 [Actinomadura sp. NBRC 104412]